MGARSRRQEGDGKGGSPQGQEGRTPIAQGQQGRAEHGRQGWGEGFGAAHGRERTQGLVWRKEGPEEARCQHRGAGAEEPLKKTQAQERWHIGHRGGGEGEGPVEG